MRPMLKELTETAYRRARYRAMRETGLPLETFPEGNPFSDAEIWEDEPQLMEVE